MTQLAIGLMSGTSLDGVDIALVAIDETQSTPNVTLVAGSTIPYPSALQANIRQILNPTSCTAAMICSVHFRLAETYASFVLDFLAVNHVAPKDIAFIASHGQTIYHINDESGLSPSSLQLGDGSVLSTLTGIPVVCNFRNADIAAGGTGAPLVPFFDYLMFQNQTHGVAVHNLGGISNLTVVPSEATIKDIVAFDTGPANVLINEAMELLYHAPMDTDGTIASQGTIHQPLVQTILAHPFFDQKPPKSTGREQFGRAYVQDLLSHYAHLPKEDIIASVTKATAQSIIQAYQQYVLPHSTIDEIVLSGGGCYNQTLVSYIQEGLPTLTISNSADYGIHPNYKEAMAFAILGYHTMHGLPSNVPGATGAKQRVVLGQISIPAKEVL